MSGWPTKPLGEVCTFLNGLWTGKKPPFEQAIVFRNTNFRPHGRLDDSDVALLEVETKQLTKRKLLPGDIIIEKSGGGPKQAVGRVAYFDKTGGNFSFSNFTSAARIIDRNEVEPQYLTRFLDWCYVSGMTEGMQSHSTGIRNLDFNAYKAINVPLPPLEEQRRIVAVLDEAFAAIAQATTNAEKNLANARELFAARREQLLRQPPSDWLESPLSELCTIKHGFAFKSEYFSENGDHILLTPGNFFESGGYRDRGQKQKFYDGPVPEDFVLKGGDLLVAMTEQAAGLLGRPIIVPFDGVFLHNQRLGLVQPKPDIEWENEFFFHVFNTCHLRDEVHRTGNGQKVRHTSPTKIGDVVVRFPRSRNDQLAMAEYLSNLWEETELLYDVQASQLVKLALLKQSLLHRAFTGELTAKPELALA
ncbi:restriction endonuclease subunit S [Novosphingobium humi]|uniref:Restriction endonuclease subunit S n=1 Tax=Novosphingobium humi TaxID=2282397 RepID=A0ABY7U007_9SPHN|nr:restriction endonuclease subunit S [Novosphingobium humi]WCT78116.1 restriction endonuclease subunit S [Novosphingobium humi]